MKLIGKTRLIAKCYNQIEGLDYKDKFSFIAKLNIVRPFIALATNKQWPIFQLDINNAFLHDHLDEEVYMQPSHGYDKVLLGQVCLLKRSLYAFKQASTQWNIELLGFLKSVVFLNHLMITIFL